MVSSVRSRNNVCLSDSSRRAIEMADLSGADSVQKRTMHNRGVFRDVSRDKNYKFLRRLLVAIESQQAQNSLLPVSYTHLTLPTKRIV